MINRLGRVRLLKAIAVLLPLLFLLLVEGLLRLFGAGHSTRLFVRDPDNPAYYVMNPDASALYFSDIANATKGNIERFPVHKAPGTLRIFVLGESTTAGYPYFHNGSFHRWLQYRLMHTFPDREIEIINTSLTAVNSWTVLGFGRQVLDYQPDAVLVYAGHNEYYGALGIGSTSRIGGSRFLIRTILWLRQFRLVQVLQRLFHSSAAVDDRQNLMQRMASKQTIPFGSPDFIAGVRQFEENMEELCQVFDARHVPVFLSTLVRNERDREPFISVRGSGGADVLSAAGFFRRADSLFARGDFVAARRDYCTAADRDLLRFRAPDTLNTLIRRLAVRYPATVHLVDTRAVFEAASPHGILGKETLLEHVHPNLYGYALMSDAYYGALRTAQVISPVAGHEMPFDSLLRRMPVTPVDSLNGAYQIMMLETRWPFNKPLPAGYRRGDSPDEELAGALAVGSITWLDAMNRVFRRCLQANDKPGALRAVEAAMLDHPENLTYLAFCGRLCFETGRQEEGITYFRRLYRIEPSSSNAQGLLFAYIKAGQPQRALVFLSEQQSAAGGRVLQQYKTLLEQMAAKEK